MRMRMRDGAKSVPGQIVVREEGNTQSKHNRATFFIGKSQDLLQVKHKIFEISEVKIEFTL